MSTFLCDLKPAKESELFGMSRCVFVYFPEKRYQYYEYPTAVSTVQKKVMHYKAMHKEVPSLEFCRIDIYTFLARVQHAHSKLITVRRSDIHKTVTIFCRTYYPSL